MDKIQEMLSEFHKKHNQGPVDVSSEAWKKRADWTLEEANEFAEAVDCQDRIAMADALADIVYLCYGSAHRMGIDLTACVREVHRSNMTKDVGPDGKAVKGPDYQRPDIGSVTHIDNPDVTTLAKHLISAVILDALLSNSVSHGDCPDIGVNDWAKVYREITSIASNICPARDQYDDAYARLSAKAYNA